MSETLNRQDLDATAGELVAALADRRIGALELTEAAIARIEARDGAINAVVVRDFERARSAARTADAALSRGERRPLLGLPMTVKESHNVAGLPTTWGFDFGRGFIAAEDSVGVARLKAAGAVILGKTNIPVGLADWQSVNPIYGRTRNPWDLERSPGGSSGGGAAAVAAGLVPLEFGSDIGGSIRVPAAFCGVFGHKPSYELIPQRGHAPPQVVGPGVVLAVVGPLARSAADLGLALNVLAGPDEGEAVGYRLDLPPPRGTQPGEFRVLLLDALPDVALDDEVAAAVHDVGARLEALGARVDRAGAAAIPDMSEQREVYSGLLQTALSRGNPEATPISAHQWLELLDRQWRIRRQWAELFQNYDIVLAPAHGTPAFPHDDSPPDGRLLSVNGTSTPYFAQIGWASLATLGNLPATVAPVGLTRGGLPIGLQAIGPYLEDRTTLAFAALLEREFGGARRPPAR